MIIYTESDRTDADRAAAYAEMNGMQPPAGVEMGLTYDARPAWNEGLGRRLPVLGLTILGAALLIKLAGRI